MHGIIYPITKQRKKYLIISNSMCMKSQLSTFGKHFTRAFSVMAVCGLAWACTDDFKLDDEKPSWLNASIYESLQQGLTDDNGTHHTFNTYLQLLADKDVNLTDSTGEYKVRPLTEVLSRTGSKTVFVAGDDAWEQFFKDNAKLPANNPWHNATSYSNLTPAQKKLLIHTSMLNNAIVMENLASSDGRGTDAPTRGEYMRRFTDVELTDTITYIAPEDLPFAYNIDKEYPEENVYDDNGNFIGKKAFVPEKNYWTEFGPKGNNKGIYLVMDSTANMMLHFTAEHMSNNAVRDEDFAIFMGRERATDDVHIYDAKVLANKLRSIPGIIVTPSDTNFMLCSIKQATAAQLKAYLLEKHQFLIRDASNFAGLKNTYFRISTQKPEYNDELVGAITTFIKEKNG